MADCFSKSRFTTFLEAKNTVENYCKKNFHPIFIQTKQTVGEYNLKLFKEESRIKNLEDPEILKISWACKHSGKNDKILKPGQRKRKSHGTNCLMAISLSYDRTSSKYYFQKCVLEHNHPHGKDVYDNYPAQRIPHGELKDKIRDLLAQGISSTLVLKRLNSQGLKTTIKDLSNIKHEIKLQGDLKNNTKKDSKKIKVNKKTIVVETSSINKRHKKIGKKIKNKNIAFKNKHMIQGDNDEDNRDRSELENDDYRDTEGVMEVYTSSIGKKRTISQPIEKDIINEGNIKKGKSRCGAYDSTIKKPNLFEIRKNLFNVTKMETETHVDYKARFEQLYEKSRIEEMSKEQLKCFHFTKAYKETEEDYIQKMTEKMTLNEKTTLEELVHICEEVDQMKTQLKTFNDTLEQLSDDIVQDCGCFDGGITLHWRNDCPEYKRSDFPKIQLLKEFEKVLEERSDSRKSGEDDIRIDKDDFWGKLNRLLMEIRNNNNYLSSFTTSLSSKFTSNNIYSSNSFSVCSVSPSNFYCTAPSFSNSYRTAPSNPCVNKKAQINPSSSSKSNILLSTPISLSFGNVKSNDSIVSGSDNKKTLKKIVIINKKGVSSSSVTPISIATFKSSTFGNLKNNNAQNFEINKMWDNNMDVNNTKKDTGSEPNMSQEYEDNGFLNEEKQNERKILFYTKFYSNQNYYKKIMEKFKKTFE